MTSLAGLAALFTAYSLYGAGTEISMVRTVETRILQPLDQLLAQSPMEHYQADLRGPDSYDTSPMYLQEFASKDVPGRSSSGGPLVLRYNSIGCPVELPPGRQLMVSMRGSVVDHADITFPMEPMTWDEMQTQLAAIIQLFDSSGWKRQEDVGSIKSPIRPADFNQDAGPKFVQMGHWAECNDGPARAYLKVSLLNSLSSGSFIPPVALSEPMPEDAEDRFIILVSFDANEEIDGQLSELIDARRSAEGLDPAMEKLPASIWLDDPDWRPPGWTGGF